MASWTPILELPVGEGPLFSRLAEAITAEVARGRIAPGARLPSSRTLAAQLGMSRNTVVAAYEELCSHGVVEFAGTRGAYVLGVPRLAAAEPARPGPGFEVPSRLDAPSRAPRDGKTLLLLGGVPELRAVPLRAFARAYRSALLDRRHRELLDYADPQGHPRLRQALCDLVIQVRGITASPAELSVVRGSTHGLYLAARALCAPGDVVAVEVPGYQPAWKTLELAGATVVPVPIDGDGLNVDALAALCAARPVRAVYTTPHHQYPTTVSMTQARRTQLLALAERQRMILFEDDYDHEFHYAPRPVLPLAAADRAGVVVYLGTLSKSVAPGLRLGYVVSAPEVARRIAAYRAYSDGQGDQVQELAIAILLEEGELQRHVRRVQGLYRARRDALGRALRRSLPALRFELPRGGLALWARMPGVDSRAWAQRSLAHGVAFQPEDRFHSGAAPGEHLRLGFAACDEPELEEAVSRMAGALPG